MSKGSGGARNTTKSGLSKQGSPRSEGTPPKEIAVNPDSKKTREQIMAEKDRRLRRRVDS